MKVNTAVESDREHCFRFLPSWSGGVHCGHGMQDAGRAKDCSVFDRASGVARLA